MPTPFKWMPDQSFAGSTAREPEVLGLANGRFLIGYTSGAGDKIYSFAYSNAPGENPNVASTPGGQIVGQSYASVSLAQTTDGAIIAAATREPTAGGGNLEDVVFQKLARPGAEFIGTTLPIAAVPNGALADQQLHNAVAGGLSNRYLIAWADYTGTDSVNTVVYRGGDSPSIVNPLNTTPGLYAISVGSFDYHPISATGLSNGNYVVAWSGADFSSRFRLVDRDNNPVSAEITVNAGGAHFFWPDVAELADGRFVVAGIGGNAGRIAIYNPDGSESYAATPFTDSVNGSFAARVSVAGLADGRFVVVWMDGANDVRGQMFLSDGTEDGAEFAVATVTTGTQGRPSVDALADGRFMVAWETDETGTPGLRYTIFDPRVGNQILTGSSDGDFLQGTSFDDAVYGGTGDDQVFGNAGADYLRGGDGLDTLHGGEGGDLLFGEQQADTLFGDNGDDFLYGGLGNDVLSGGAGNDTLYGDENNDTLNGDANDDVLIGGTGNDLMYGGDGADSADGGAGNDIFYGGAGADYAAGGDGDDVLIGEGDNDRLEGGAGADSIDGGLGADIIYGGAGADTIQGGAGGDVLIGEAGADDINGGADDDSIDGGADADTLRGGDGSDFIQGGSGADSLFGDAGADTLNGGDDGDTLTGGTGGDTMTGGAGFDVFYFAVNSGVDVITDFQDNIDKINLSTYAGATFANTIIAQSGANTVVAFGGGFADQVILLNFTATNLTVTDFVF